MRVGNHVGRAGHTEIMRKMEGQTRYLGVTETIPNSD